MNKANMIMAGVTAASLAVGAAAVLTGYKAAGTAEAYARQCIELQDENRELKKALLADTKERRITTRDEVVITVRAEENARRTRARANRNICNVKVLPGGELWRGQIGHDDKGHAIFSDDAYGLRAAGIVLCAYQRKHGIKTIDALVDRFCEGNRDEYKNYLAKRLGIGVKQTFSIRERLVDLIIAMAKFESGVEIDPTHKALLKVASL